MSYALVTMRLLFLAFALFSTTRTLLGAWSHKDVDTFGVWAPAILWALFALSMGWLS